MDNGAEEKEGLWRYIRAAQDGDTEAFGRVYEELFTPIFRYFFSRLKDKEQAEDLAQTVFVKVLESLDRLEEQEVAARAYFFTVARNTLIDHFRKKKSLSLDSMEEVVHTLATDEQNPQEYAKQQEKSDVLERALDELTEDQREAVELRFLHGLSHEEVAESLKKSNDAVRQLQVRALRRLKDILKDNYEGHI